MNVEVTCVDDKNHPNEIPESRRVKKGEKYHIIKLDKLLGHGGIYGVKLAEINNDDLAPYQYFRLDRFAIEMTEEQFQEFLAKANPVATDLTKLTELTEA